MIKFKFLLFYRRFFLFIFVLLDLVEADKYKFMGMIILLIYPYTQDYILIQALLQTILCCFISQPT